MTIISKIPKIPIPASIVVENPAGSPFKNPSAPAETPAKAIRLAKRKKTNAVTRLAKKTTAPIFTSIQ